MPRLYHMLKNLENKRQQYLDYNHHMLTEKFCIKNIHWHTHTHIYLGVRMAFKMHVQTWVFMLSIMLNVF